MRLFIFILLSIGFLHAQIGLKKSFKLDKGSSAGTDGFLGNGIVDIVVNGDDIWVGTGFGLNLSTDGGHSWTRFSPADYNLKGGITAMGVMDAHTVWIATAFDTTARGEDLVAGGGLAYTRNKGQSWVQIKQPVDSKDEQNYAPTTTNIQNITYDIAFVDSTIWIASFGGGLRRSDDMGKSWQVVNTDNKPFNSLQNFNDRAFSLLAENGNLWYGSAEGISFTPNNGDTWQRFKFNALDSTSISGNFVVALGWQEEKATLWAATIEAVAEGEKRGLSFTTNGGITWQRTLLGTFPHNFAFIGARAYAAADEGMFISENLGESWYTLPTIIDEENQNKLLSDVYFSAGAQPIPSGGTRLLAGSQDGLAITEDNGLTWKIIRSFISTRKRTSPAVYAYPSPFSPKRNGFTRFQFDISKTTQVDISIYNFAMEEVITLSQLAQNSNSSSVDRSVVWDGKDFSGKFVANGLYFFKAKVGSKTTWGKLVIIN